MTNFFLASGLILGISLLIISYYWLKQLVKNRQDNNRKKLIQRKDQTDEKEYLRNFISYHLEELIKNEIQWIMIWSKSDSEFKTELTYNPLNSKINIKARNITSLDNHKLELAKIGVTEFEERYDTSIFELMPNAKMITDVLYYIFEDIHLLKRFSNHKIISSSD